MLDSTPTEKKNRKVLEPHKRSKKPHNVPDALTNQQLVTHLPSLADQDAKANSAHPQLHRASLATTSVSPRRPLFRDC